MTKISIVTISYNQAEFLEQAILSVLAHSGANVEYIIVDPGSTDGSRDIIERYRDKISHVIYEKDDGPADGLNKGFSLATGDLFGYLNSDDFYLPGALMKISEAADQFRKAGAIVGNGVLVDQDGFPFRRSISKKFSLRAVGFGAAFSLQQATFYRREAFQAVGGFNLANGTCWDGEILVDIALAGFPVENFHENLGAFRIHNASITGSGRLTEQYRVDATRLVRKALGRPLTRTEQRLVAPMYRLSAHLRDPRRAVELLLDSFNRMVRRPSSSAKV